MNTKPVRHASPDHPISITPYPGRVVAVAAIRGHVAFYPDRVDSIARLA
jgi:uncharacterized protein (DUF427 family)